MLRGRACIVLVLAAAVPSLMQRASLVAFAVCRREVMSRGSGGQLMIDYVMRSGMIEPEPR